MLVRSLRSFSSVSASRASAPLLFSSMALARDSARLWYELHRLCRPDSYCWKYSFCGGQHTHTHNTRAFKMTTGCFGGGVCGGKDGWLQWNVGKGCAQRCLFCATDPYSQWGTPQGLQPPCCSTNPLEFGNQAEKNTEATSCTMRRGEIKHIYEHRGRPTVGACGLRGHAPTSSYRLSSQRSPYSAHSGWCPAPLPWVESLSAPDPDWCLGFEIPEKQGA